MDGRSASMYVVPCSAHHADQGTIVLVGAGRVGGPASRPRTDSRCRGKRAVEVALHGDDELWGNQVFMQRDVLLVPALFASTSLVTDLGCGILLLLRATCVAMGAEAGTRKEGSGDVKTTNVGCGGHRFLGGKDWHSICHVSGQDVKRKKSRRRAPAGEGGTEEGPVRT